MIVTKRRDFIKYSAANCAGKSHFEKRKEVAGNNHCLASTNARKMERF